MVVLVNKTLAEARKLQNASVSSYFLFNFSKAPASHIHP